MSAMNAPKILRRCSWLLLLCAAAAAADDKALTEVPLDRLQAPSPGKSVVFFFRPGRGSAVTDLVQIYDQTKLVTLLGPGEYVRYETEPGIRTFVGRDRRGGFDLEWVHADLEPGGIYAVFVSRLMSQLDLVPLTGQMDRLVVLESEGGQWADVLPLLDEPSQPSLAGGEAPDAETAERVASIKELAAVNDAVLGIIASKEQAAPGSTFKRLTRLNLEGASLPAVAEVPRDRLPAPVPGKSLVLFFFPQVHPDQRVAVFDGERRLGPDLTGGAYYTYETSPGPTNFWVPEVRWNFSSYRLVPANLEPEHVYAVYVLGSLGSGGARLFGLMGNMDDAFKGGLDKTEAQAWSVVESLLGSPGRAIAPSGETIGGKELKSLSKDLKDRAKRRVTEVGPLL
jgi:hypothetical protein